MVSKHIHLREIETLHFFNGKYMGYCLKYYTETMSLRVLMDVYEFNKNIVKYNC